MRRIAPLLPLIALAACSEIIAVNLDQSSICETLALNDSLQLNALTLRGGLGPPSVAYSSLERPAAFDWSSSAPEVLSVNRRGVVVARSLGAATISVRAEGEHTSGSFVVAAARTTASVNPEFLVLQVGDSAFVAARAWDSVGVPLDLVAPREPFRFWAPWTARASAVDVHMAQAGAWIVATRRGSTVVTWAFAGRCGMVPTLVR